jgi:hypothetical protein
MADFAGSVSPRRALPLMRTSPASGRSRPAIIPTVVLSPAPLGPSSPTTSPAPTLNETSDTAVMAP